MDLSSEGQEWATLGLAGQGLQATRSGMSLASSNTKGTEASCCSGHSPLGPAAPLAPPSLTAPVVIRHLPSRVTSRGSSRFYPNFLRGHSSPSWPVSLHRPAVPGEKQSWLGTLLSLQAPPSTTSGFLSPQFPGPSHGSPTRAHILEMIAFPPTQTRKAN